MNATAPPTTTLLRVDDLHAGYGPIEVLHGLSLTVEAGEIVVILGANGAGKTTTMRAISGTIARRGSIELARDGSLQSIAKASPDAIVRLGLVQVPQGRGTFPDLTVEDNLRIGAHTRRDGGTGADIARWFDTFPRLAERRAQKAGSLSGGEQQMLAIGRAMMSRPQLLLLDEPSMGIAPVLVDRIYETIEEINKRGTTILLVEQNANYALSVSTRGYVLETGAVAVTDSSDNLRSNPDVQAAYLGGD